MSNDRARWFFNKVQAMRQAQREYFKTRSHSVLRQSKALEREADAVMLDTEQQRALALEIGDVLWYCATLARDIDMALEEVAELNIAKINSRKQRGKLGGSGDNR